MSNLDHQHYLDGLFRDNQKLFVEIIDLGLFINDLKQQMRELDDAIEEIHNNIKRLQSQLKIATREEKARLIIEIKQINVDKNNIIEQKNELLKTLNDSRVKITRKGHETYFVSPIPGNKLFVDYVIDDAVNNNINLNKFLNAIKDYMELRYMSNVAKDKLYDMNSGKRFEKVALLDSFQTKINVPSTKRVLGDHFLRYEIESYLNERDVRGGKKTRKYKRRKSSKRKKLYKRNKSKKCRMFR